jgi:hypothetical protein
MTLTRPALALLLCLSASRSFSQCSDDFSGTALKPAWTFIDVDNAPGGAAAVNDNLTLTGKGADIYDTTNQFVGIWRSDVKGDFDVSVKIVSQDSTHSYAQAGILVANSVGDLSLGGFAVLDISPGHGYTLFTDKKAPMGRLDTHVGMGKTVYPAWLRMVRKGTQLSAYFKTSSGAAWTPVQENTTTLGMQANSQIALISLSHNVTTQNHTVFDDFGCVGTSPSAISLLPYRAGYVNKAPAVDAAGRLHGKSDRSHGWSAGSKTMRAPEAPISR